MPTSPPPRPPRVSLPVVWQLLGLVLADVGLYLLAGVAWALLGAGAALVVWGVVGEVAAVAVATRPRRRPSGPAVE